MDFKIMCDYFIIFMSETPFTMVNNINISHRCRKQILVGGGAELSCYFTVIMYSDTLK